MNLTPMLDKLVLFVTLTHAKKIKIKRELFYVIKSEMCHPPEMDPRAHYRFMDVPVEFK